MSFKLRKEQCCKALVDGKQCLRPSRELGGLCTAHWRALSAPARAHLQWGAAWEDSPERPLFSKHLTTPQVGAIALLSYDPAAGAEAILAAD